MKKKKSDENEEKRDEKSRVIRVSADVYRVLQNSVIGFERPDDVLRRLLNLPPKTNSNGG